MQIVPPFVQKQQVWLHLLLVVGIFVYLYSPLLDHWSGTVHTRPHTHIQIAESAAAKIGHQHENDDEADLHEEGVLCLLDFTTQLSVLLQLELLPVEQFMYQISLVFDVVPSYILLSSIHLSSLDPPPRI